MARTLTISYGEDQIVEKIINPIGEEGSVELDNEGAFFNRDIIITSDKIREDDSVLVYYDGETVATISSVADSVELATKGNIVYKTISLDYQYGDIASNEYVRFETPLSNGTPFTLSATGGTKTWDGTLEYSVDKVNWSVWDGSITTAGTTEEKYCLWLRGTNNTYLAGTSQVVQKPFVFANAENLEGHGNIMTLLDYDKVLEGISPDMGQNCFRNLFRDCTTLKTAPRFPATKLSIGCYYGTFYNCTSLTTAPTLPATTVASDCYSYMFMRCRNLSVAPELPATTMVTRCYKYMFSETGLLLPPTLPATKLSSECYYGMFSRCASLQDTPELPAISLYDSCYSYMFSSCYSLTEAPELPSLDLASNCYSYMFHDCTGLTKSPNLPADDAKMQCYRNMFSDCTNLETIGKINLRTTHSACCRSMFSGCTSLTELPQLLPTLLDTYCYAQMFYGCSNICVSTSETGVYNKEYKVPFTYYESESASNALNDMFTNTGGTFTGTPSADTVYYVSNDIVESDSYYVEFSSDSAFSISASYKTWNGQIECRTGKTSYGGWSGSVMNATLTNGKYRLYLRGTNNTHIGRQAPSGNKIFNLHGNITVSGKLDNLLDWGKLALDKPITKDDYCYAFVFANTGVKNAENLILSDEMPNYCYVSAFFSSGLVTPPRLPAIELTTQCYRNMFNDCRSLVTAPSLPATTMKSGCYSYMFANSGLLEAPSLPSLELDNNCYQSMFSGCSNLTEVPALPATNLSSGCYASMFYGCSSVTEPPLLPATTMKTNCYSSMFYNCYQLQHTPALPATTLASGCYSAMFYGCTNITTPPALPATTLATSCYSSMFSGCTRLQCLPSLQATTLPTFCYNGMFRNCSLILISTTQSSEYPNAFRIPQSGSGSAASDSLKYMFTGTGGTYTGDAYINATYYTSNTIV